MYWPEKLSLAQLPTPFHLLPRLSAELGVNIWLKRDDLSGFVLSGNKVRKLEYLLSKAQSEGATTVITCGGLQSNHCRATAFACASLGLKCHLVLRDGDKRQSGNLFLDQLAGAMVTVFSAPEYTKNLTGILRDLACEYEGKGEVAFVIPTGGSDGVGVWGYVQAAFELQGDCAQHNINPSHVVCASGSGGTQAGLAAGCALAGMDCEVLGFAVCDDERYFLDKIARDIESWQSFYPEVRIPSPLKFNVNDDYVGLGYAKSRNEELVFIAELARTEGVLLDPVYSGKALFGLVSEIRKDASRFGSDVVFVHTGGGFGVFAYEQQWQQILNC